VILLNVGIESDPYEILVVDFFADMLAGTQTGSICTLVVGDMFMRGQ